MSFISGVYVFYLCNVQKATKFLYYYAMVYIYVLMFANMF